MKTVDLGVHIPMNITAITPVHIGGGAVWSPLADYWLDEKQIVHLVNESGLSEAVLETGNIEKYIKEVESVVDTKKGTMLHDFVRYSLKKEMSNLLSGVSYKSVGIRNPVEIDCCIRTNGLAYIPGSSLKGAIRNALLLNWLCSGKPESEKALTDFIQALRLFSKRNDLKRKQQAAEIERVFRESAEEEFFGRLKSDQRLAASCLRVTDSDPISESALSVYQLGRFNISTGIESIPVLKLCIDKGISTAVEINIDYYNTSKKVHHSVLKDVAGKRELFALLNAVSLRIIDYEISVLAGIDSLSGKMSIYEDILRGIRERILNNQDRKSYLRLGFGKMQFYQTIAMALFQRTGKDENNSDWIEYLSYCDGMSGDLPAFYPSTRLLTSTGLEPIGWVELG